MLSLLLLLATPAYAGEPREFVFLLDRSASMTSKKGSFQDYDAAIGAAKVKAGQLLSPYADDPNVSVSLYFFGDIHEAEGEGEWAPNLERMSGDAPVPVSKALGLLNDFFLPAVTAGGASNYAQPWTYVAASVHSIVADRYQLTDPCAPPVPRDGVPLLSLFVFTDEGDDGSGGGESAPTARDTRPEDRARYAWDHENERHKAWLARQDLTNALSYTHWSVGANQVEIAKAAAPVYRVQWVSKDRGSFNLRDPRLLEPQAQVLEDLVPRIRLVPEGAAPTAAWAEAHPELLCLPKPAPVPRATQAGKKDIDIIADWRTHSGGRDPRKLDGLKLSYDARSVTNGVYVLTTLRADLEGMLNLRIPANAKGTLMLAEGKTSGMHKLLPNRDTLCEVLQDAYPDSTFRFPPDAPSVGGTADLCAAPAPAPLGGYPLAPFATVSLVDRDVVTHYPFQIVADGGAPDAGVSLGVDRWWRATGGLTRTLRMGPHGRTPPGWTVKSDLTVLRDGKPLDEYGDVASFAGNFHTEASSTDANDLPLQVSLPGRGQRWWRMGADFPIGSASGELQARICFDVQVNDPKVHDVSISCPSCTAEDSLAGAGNCIFVPVHVDSRPFGAVWRIVALASAVLLSLWVAHRWLTRPRFPNRFTVGGLLVRKAAEDWWKDPALLAAQLRATFIDNAGLVVYINLGNHGVVRGVSTVPTGTYGLALRARPGSPLAWCSRLPDGARLNVPGVGTFSRNASQPLKADNESSFIFSDDADLSAKLGEHVEELVRVFPRGADS
jgi:hypothetical protein